MSDRQLYDANTSINGLGTLGEFWQWALSDLLGNTNRGVFAEYLVGKLIGADLSMPRMEWAGYDLTYRDHGIEVKSSAYVQSWHTSPDQRSRPTFGVSTHTNWDPLTGDTLPQKKRWADIYVFCIFPTDPDDLTRDVLDLSKWGFYITTTTHLEQFIASDTRQVGLNRVETICGAPVDSTQLKARIDALIDAMSQD